MALKFLKKNFMKNLSRLTIILVGIISVNTLFAQKGFFQGRIIAGVNFTQVDGDSFGGFNKLGGQLGVGVQTTKSKGQHFSFSIDATITQKGSHYVSKDQSGQVLLEYKMALLMTEVPMLLSYHFSKFYIEAGPGFSYLLSAKEKDANGELNNRPEFNKLEVSGIVGFGVEVSKHSDFVARFSKSISPIRSSDVQGRYRVAGGEYNRALHLIYRYRF